MQPSSKQARIDRDGGQVECLGRLVDGKLFDIAQHKDYPQIRIELVQTLPQDFCQFRCGAQFFSIRCPIGHTKGQTLSFEFQILDQQLSGEAQLSHLHERLVQGDADQPG